jgi:hypothetical protein
MESSVAQDVGGAWHERRDEPIAKPELATEPDGGGLLHEHRVGAAVDHPAVESIGPNDSAESIGGFEETDADAAALELVGRGEARNASADDGYIDLAHRRDTR